MNKDQINSELITKIEFFKEILIDKATDQNSNEVEYKKLYKEIIFNQEIQPYLPKFIQKCRNLDDFWHYTRYRFDNYEDCREHIREEFFPVFNYLESKSFSKVQPKSYFEEQFPLGIAFGIKKPNLAIVPYKKGQKISFEETNDIGLIRNSVYPNFTYSDLLESVKNISLLKCSLDFKQTLINICQTDSEKVFFEFYLKNYVLRHKNIPILIPQVWIQWHSKTKNELRFDQSSYTDDLYRVDFVAFWNNKRYAILIDDINHYAQKNYEYWNADESKYSKRLREDRKLRKEGWEVFRISNWEIRQEKLMFEIVNDLFDYLEININFNLD